MKDTYCGIDCGECDLKSACGGCRATGGKPFGGDCVLAKCCTGKGKISCESDCDLKKKLIAEFNALGIADMPEVTELCALRGEFVNVEYTLRSGQKVKFWDDNKIYLGYQLEKADGKRCYGLTADESCLMVCEYGENGTNPEIIVFKKR